MKVIIIEDEKLSAEHLGFLLKKINPATDIVTMIDSVKNGIKVLSSGIKADLIFVDVHLADGLSFEIFSKIQIDTPVVFTTAYDEYAIKAFSINSIGYLLKPITIDDLKESLAKYNKLNSIYKTNIINDLSSVYKQENKQYKNRFMVKLGEHITSVKTDEVNHFVCEDKVVILAAVNGKRYVIDYTLDNLEKIISPETFFRINRNVIIHINRIEKVSTYFNSRLKIDILELPEEQCIVSRERVNDFKKWLDK